MLLGVQGIVAAQPEVSKAAGLDVRWTAPTTGTVEIELNVSQSTLRCQVPASTQLKSIPSAALSLLPNNIGALVVGRAARTTVSGGGVTDVSSSVRDTRYGVVTLTPQHSTC